MHLLGRRDPCFGLRVYPTGRRTYLVQGGASLHLVRAVLNHKDPKTTAGYAYFQMENRQAVLDRHGERLREIAARPSTRPRGSHRRNIARQVANNGRSVRRFTRRELYDLVWSKPISKLAATYGVSDAGLAKACRRANIPVPRR